MRDLDRLRRAYIDVVNPPKPPNADFDVLWDLWTAVMVYGTPEAQSLAEQCSDAIGLLQKNWECDDTADSAIDQLMDSWHEFLAQIRKDLGVSGDDGGKPARVKQEKGQL
jgi:hypothetical protein